MQYICKNKSCCATFEHTTKAKPWLCKPCRRKYDSAHHARRSSDSKSRKVSLQAARRQELADRLNEYLASHPCVDCGERDVVVLEFDHRDSSNKLSEVSRLVQSGNSWLNIFKEVSKCDVRCCNCHRRRTAKQFGWDVRKRMFQDLMPGNDPEYLVTNAVS